MTTKKKARKAVGADGVETVSAKVGDKFTYTESGTVVAVTCVYEDEEGNATVDVQEPDGAKRYWGAVPSDSEWLAPAPAEE